MGRIGPIHKAKRSVEQLTRMVANGETKSRISQLVLETAALFAVKL